MKGIFNDLKKLDTFFSGTTICALVNNLCVFAISGLTFAPTSLLVNPINKFDLYLKEDESFALTLSIFPADSYFVHLFCIAIKILKYVNNYLSTQLNYTNSL